MADRLYLKPTDPDAIVRHQAPLMDRVLPPEGNHVPDTQFWRRRIAAKEVVIAKPPRTPKTEG